MRIPLFNMALLGGLMVSGTVEAARRDELPDPLSNIHVDKAILETVERQLPERQAIGAAFLDEAYQPTLTLDDPSQLAVTFVSEGAGYRNAVGYFTYEDGTFDDLTFGDIDRNRSGNITARELERIEGVEEIDILFANNSAVGSGGRLTTGDTMVIGGGTIAGGADGWSISDGTVFDAGTNVGFFLAANAWDGRKVTGFDTGQDIATYYSLDFLNPENGADATVEDVSRSTRHVAMLNVSDAHQVLMGFEDLNRNTGDNDFNDAVLIIRSDPYEALDNSPIPTVSAAPLPPIGQGAAGLAMIASALTLAVRRWRQRRT